MEEPRIITETHTYGTRMSIADSLLQHNEIWLEGEVTVEAVNEIISLLHIMEQKCASKNNGIIQADVKLLISGPGGSISAALNLANYLQNTPLNVTTIAVNNCSSSSALIWLAGKHRQILPFSRLMFHEVSHTVCEYSKYKVERIKEICDDMTALNNEIVKMISKSIRIAENDVKRMISGKEYYLSAQEAVSHGFADEIINTL